MILEVPIAAATIDEYIFVAPMALQIKAVRFFCTVVANSIQTVALQKVPVASQPVAVNGTGTVAVTAAATPVGSGATANTPAVSALSTTAAASQLAAGDLLAIHISAALTSLVGGFMQIEMRKQ